MRTPAALLAALLLALAAAPAAAGERIAILPLRGAPAAGQVAWLAEGLAAGVGLFLAGETGWEPLAAADAAAVAAAWGPAEGPPAEEAKRLLAAAGVRAALAGTFQAQAGSIRLQADLYPDVAGGGEPLHLSLNGKVNQVFALASAVAEVAGEALEGRFPRVLRPPQPSPPEFLLARLEPSFGARNPLENFQQSETFLLTALKIDPKNADAFFQLGTLYARNNAPEKALENLRIAVELSPKSPRYHWGLGVAHYQRGQLEEALTEFLQSTVIDETFVEGLVALAALQRRLGDAEAGEEALAKAVQARPADPLALTALGVSAYLARDPARARGHFEKARAADPRSAAASINLALLEWEQGNLDAARRELERAVAADPGSPEALNDLGVVEGARGAYDQAAGLLQRALGAGAARRTALHNLGTFQMQAGQLDEAAATLQRAVDLDPEYAPARNNLALLQLARGRVDEALATLGAPREDAPGAELVAYNAALLHQMRRNGQQALVHYLRAIQLRRDLVPAHVNLGILFEGMGRPEKALTEYLKALSSGETIPEVYTYLGQIYAQRGYGSMADETVRKTTLVDTGSAIAWHTLATGMETTDRGGAAAAWRQFLEAVRRDRNRAFWVAVAERRLAALGSPP